MIMGILAPCRTFHANSVRAHAFKLRWQLPACSRISHARFICRLSPDAGGPAAISPSSTAKMSKPVFDQVRRRTTSDPLAAAMLPPPNESPVDRENRLKAEYDARKVSEHIDELIRQERKEKNKTRPEVNVLLLGQSESGKSTTLKRESPPSLVSLSLLSMFLDSVTTSSSPCSLSLIVLAGLCPSTLTTSA